MPTTLQDALKAEVVIFAVPFRAYRKIASVMVDWSGKIVIDAMNARDLTPEELSGRESSDILALALPGAKVVKTFNQLPAALLGSDPFQPSARRNLVASRCIECEHPPKTIFLQGRESEY
ncbi:putative dinucleotide-binding enzyme [Undibacterium sp. GrIS 1.8]|uniref:NAD(P)-binding domain-containing protein n=1 Tax=unclassified Undibacterium TaxID=2630295 RepID=UPI0033945E00